MLHVRATISRFQVDPDKIKRRPYSTPENFHVNILLRRQWNIVAQLLLCGTKVFLVDQVNLVQNRQGRNIPSIPRHYIDQLIVRNVVSNDDTSVRNPVNLHDPLDRFLGEPRQLYRAGNGGSSFVCPCDYNIWPLLIQTYTHRLKLVPQQLDLTRLKNVQDQKNQIGIPSDGEDALASSFARACAADYSRKVENLDVSPVQSHNSRNNGQCCECVCCDFGFRIRQSVENGRFSDTRKPVQDYVCGSGFFDFKTLSSSFATAVLFDVIAKFG